jgi:hypothetical protein
MSKELKDLALNVQGPAAKALEEMKSDLQLKKLGVTGILISETLRPLAVQMAYFSRSRMAVSDVKKMYAAAGLYKISDTEAQSKNTDTLSSMHIQGRAIDLVPEIDGVIAWNAPNDVWKRMGEIGEKYGFTWGGRWPDFPDKPHFQM